MSHIYTFQRKQCLNTSLEKAWSFFSTPNNLKVITPPELDFTVTSSVPDAIYPGLFITYTVRPIFGIKLSWLTEITQVEAPHKFIDEQRVGPYRIWHHEHTFKEVIENGKVLGIEASDLIYYVLYPFPFSSLAERIFIKPQLEKIFDYRAKVLREHFGEL